MTDTRFRFGRRNFIRAVSASALCRSFCPTLFAAAMTPSPRPKALVFGGTALGLMGDRLRHVSFRS